MHINTQEDFLKLRQGIVLYHVNPYTYGSHLQDRVSIDVVLYSGGIVKDIDHNLGLKALISENLDDPQLHYISSFIPNHDKCSKFLTTSLDEALTYLSRVHIGEFTDKVKLHHDSCDRMFGGLFSG